MIRFEHVTKTYRTNIGLDDVSVDIEKGDFVFLVGPSGAGKSTFIKLILKVHRWSDVYHMAHSIHIFALIVLCKVRRLWFYHRTHIKVEALANHSKHQLYVVCIVFILRIAAQVAVVIALQRIVQS